MLSVSSLFSTRVGVYVCVCVCDYTHTHTNCTDGVLKCEPRSRDETPGGPKESGWTKSPSRHIHIRISVQSTHVYVYAKRRDEILDYLFSESSITYFSFRKRKAKDVNANHR